MEQLHICIVVVVLLLVIYYYNKKEGNSVGGYKPSIFDWKSWGFNPKTQQLPYVAYGYEPVPQYNPYGFQKLHAESNGITFREQFMGPRSLQKYNRNSRRSQIVPSDIKEIEIAPRTASYRNRKPKVNANNLQGALFNIDYDTVNNSDKQPLFQNLQIDPALYEGSKPVPAVINMIEKSNDEGYKEVANGYLNETNASY